MLGLLTVFFEDFKGVRECFAFPNFGQYKPEREGFVFNEKENRYECIKEGGNKAYLSFKRILTDSKGYQKKSYRSSERIAESVHSGQRVAARFTPLDINNIKHCVLPEKYPTG